MYSLKDLFCETQWIEWNARQEYIPVGFVPSAAVGVCLKGVWPGGVCPGVSAGGVCPEGVWGISPSRGCTPPPVDRILDTRLWKHCLSATLFAGGKNGKNLLIFLYVVSNNILQNF